MPTTTVTTAANTPTVTGRVNRNIQFSLYESNLYNTDVHPITGLATSGIHTRVRQLTTARDRSYSPSLNRPGSCKFTVPLTSPDALDIVGYEVRRCVVIFYTDPGDPNNANTRPLWSGYISGVELDAAGNSLVVTCTGWFQFLYGREFHQKVIFDTVDAGVIATRLLGTANNQNANDNVVAAGGLDYNGVDISGATAEDLLFGAGELDSIDANNNGTLSTDAITYQNQLQLGIDTPISSNVVYSTAWDYTSRLSPSGSGGISIRGTNKSNYGGMYVGKRFPATAGTTYNLRTLAYVQSLVNAGSTVGIGVAWFTSSDVLLSSTGNVAITPSVTGVYEINGTVVSPGSTVYGRAFIYITTTASSSIQAVFDSSKVSVNNVKMRPTPIIIGTVDSPANPTGANRSRTYNVGDKIGPAFEELSNIESGFDVEVATVETTLTVNNINLGVAYERKLNIRWGLVKTGTTIRGIGTDRPNVVFGYNAGPENLANMRETRDAGNLANRVNGRAAGLAAMAQDTTSMDSIGLWEDSININDPGVSTKVLLGYAGAEVTYRGRPPRRFNPSPMRNDGLGGVIKQQHRFGQDYVIGDIVYAVAIIGAMNIQGSTSGTFQPIRIFALTLGIDDEGNETVSDIETTLGS